MTGEIFKAVLITLLAGSVLAGIITLFRPITKKIFGYSWHYYIWLCVLFVMLIPVRFNIKLTPTPSIAPQAVQTEQTPVVEQSETTEDIARADTAQKPQILQKVFAVWSYNRMNILAYLWLIGAIVLILFNVVCYVRLNIKIRKNAVSISLPETEEYTDRKITVRVWENIASPFMTGVLSATLLLPKTAAEKSTAVFYMQNQEILQRFYYFVVRAYIENNRHCNRRNFRNTERPPHQINISQKRQQICRRQKDYQLTCD